MRVQQRAIAADPSTTRADGLVRPVFIECEGGELDGLPLGLRLEAIIELGSREVAVTLPRRAIAIRDGVAVVDVAGGPLATGERRVELGLVDSDHVEVRGIPAGTRVRLAP